VVEPSLDPSGDSLRRHRNGETVETERPRDTRSITGFSTVSDNTTKRTGSNTRIIAFTDYTRSTVTNLACCLGNWRRTRAPSALRASGTVAWGVASVRRGRVKIRFGRAILLLMAVPGLPPLHATCTM
jgi:hypothetical protein